MCFRPRIVVDLIEPSWILFLYHRAVQKGKDMHCFNISFFTLF